MHCQPDYTVGARNTAARYRLVLTAGAIEFHLNHVVGALDTDRAQDWVAPALAGHTLSGAPLGQKRAGRCSLCSSRQRDSRLC